MTRNSEKDRWYRDQRLDDKWSWRLSSCEEITSGAAPGSGETDLFLLPGSRFRVVDALLTNFHLPRSTLLALVMAFAGIEETRALYRTAIEERYRFYSFGDAMLVL